METLSRRRIRELESFCSLKRALKRSKAKIDAIACTYEGKEASERIEGINGEVKAKKVLQSA